MTKKYRINNMMFTVSVLTILISILLAGTMAYIGSYILIIPFLLIALAFFHEATVYGRIVEVTPEGISSFLWGKKHLSLTWNQVKEVGVAGTRVFMKSFTGTTGTLYIYFSEKEMDEQERFEMMLNWPAKDKIYLAYDNERLSYIQSIYSNEITKYNTGKKLFNTRME